MIYRPMYVDKIMAYVDTSFVKILTGVRRCGKSMILKMIWERLEKTYFLHRKITWESREYYAGGNMR